MSTQLLNSISSRICRQNTQFNMHTTTSKQQEGCMFKNSHPKCFITTNFGAGVLLYLCLGLMGYTLDTSYVTWYSHMAKVTNQVMACIFELLSRQGGKSNSNRHRGIIARSLQTLVVSVLETKNSIKSKQKLLKSRR